MFICYPFLDCEANPDARTPASDYPTVIVAMVFREVCALAHRRVQIFAGEARADASNGGSSSSQGLGAAREGSRAPEKL